MADLTETDDLDAGGLAADTFERSHTGTPLRADLSDGVLLVQPGETVEVGLQVLNTSTVITEVRVELLELMAKSLVVTPQELSLFPGESAEVRVALQFHPTLPAGEHEGTVVVSGTSEHVAPAEVPLRVVVPPAPAASLRVEPPLRTGGRRANFDLLVANEGNTPLHLQVRAADPDRVLALQLAETTLDVRVDELINVRLVARKRRPWTGPPMEYPLTVEVTGDGVELSQEVRFRQKPRLTAGVITILTLAVIVALWALAMLFGVQAALAPSPPTKMVPEAFVEGVGLNDLDATVVGGSVSGTIVAASTAKPVERATVEAFDQQGRLVGATTTGDDGAFTLDGLLPVRHRLRVSAPGFVEQWWPGASTAAGATSLLVSAEAPAEGIDSRLVGLPASLGGQAIAGDGDPIPIQVEVLPLDVLQGATLLTATADERGVWSLPGLLAPATYRITYRAEGYAPVELTQPVDAGGQVVVNTVRLPAAVGAISGLVVDRSGRPVGGVEILAQRGEEAVDFTTPTSGDVGFFSLENLSTPGTYLLTLTADGYASETLAVRLGPGEVLEGFEVVLGPATGVISGRATTADGTALGGVTVTVTGGDTVLSTGTLTSGDVGTFRIADLPLPGVYAVTFDADGYARETVQVELDSATSTAVAEVAMRPSVGSIVGVVVDDATGTPLGAVAIEVSNGSTIRETTTASVPDDERGTFRVGDLAPGTYTVTARTDDGRSITLLQSVQAGAATSVTIRLGSSP